jgi:hypothetical protein
MKMSDQLETSSWVKAIGRLADEVGMPAAPVEQLVEAAVNNIVALKLGKDRLRKTLRRREEQVEILHETLQKTKDVANMTEARVEDLNQRLHQRSMRVDELLGRVNQLNRRNEDQKQTIEELRAAKQADVLGPQTVIADQQRELDARAGVIRDLHKQVEELRARIADLNEGLRMRGKRIDELILSVGELRQMNERQRKIIEELRAGEVESLTSMTGLPSSFAPCLTIGNLRGALNSCAAVTGVPTLAPVAMGQKEGDYLRAIHRTADEVVAKMRAGREQIEKLTEQVFAQKRIIEGLRGEDAPGAERLRVNVRLPTSYKPGAVSYGGGAGGGKTAAREDRHKAEAVWLLKHAQEQITDALRRIEGEKA